jgi:hypothetical protein
MLEYLNDGQWRESLYDSTADYFITCSSLPTEPRPVAVRLVNPGTYAFLGPDGAEYLQGIKYPATLALYRE